MDRRSMRARGLVGLLAVGLMVGLVAIPVLAADPTPTPTVLEPTATPTEAPATETPTEVPSTEAPATETPTQAPSTTEAPAATSAPAADPAADPGRRGPKADRGPALDVTVTGTVGTRTDAEGRTEYTLTTGSTVRVLGAGPPWFWGDDHPLKAYVGKQVTVVGTQRAGEDEVNVVSVNGAVIRESGRPPWAGGWKAVGKDHPGWSQEKWDRWQAKRAEKAQRFGAECFPPGQCKDKSAASDDD